MKNLVLCSFFIASNAKLFSNLDHQKILEHNNESLHDMYIVIPIEEEIFPLEAIDFITQIEDFTDDLEIDPIEIFDCHAKNNQESTILEILDNNKIVDSRDDQISQTLSITVDIVIDSCQQNDTVEKTLPKNNDIKLLDIEENQNFEDESAQDDDIVPVPHELINSVKKANKKKKKLEEKQRKEKYKIFKKSKKKKK